MACHHQQDPLCEPADAKHEQHIRACQLHDACEIMSLAHEFQNP